MPGGPPLASEKNEFAFTLGKPKDIFLLLGNYLFHKKLINCTPIHFANARSEAETTAWDKANVKEVTLFQIYKELAYILHLNKELTGELMVMESTLQWMVLKNLPDDLARKNLNLSSLKNQKITKKTFYGNFNFEEHPDKNSFNGTQSFISLFDAEYKAHTKYIDINNYTDLKRTEVELFSLPYTRYENILNNYVWETGGLSSAMTGASNLERLYMQAAEADNNALIDVAAGLIAPTLVSYVLWIYNRSKALKLNRLFFFSKDGFLLYKIAGILKKKLHIDLELILISGSKSLEEVTEPDNVAIVSIFNDTHQPEIENFIKSTGIKNITICYFYLDNNQKNSIQSEGYIWDSSTKIGYKNLLANIQDIVELLFLPQKAGNTIEGLDGVSAAVSDHANDNSHDEKAIIFSTILGFTEALFLHKPFINPYNDMRPSIANLIKSFGRSPSSTEVKILNKLSQCLSFENSKKIVTRPYKLTDLFFILQNGDLHYNKYWSEGSLALTPSPFASVVKVGSKIGSRIKKMRKKF
jgi:hypothetical protein